MTASLQTHVVTSHGADFFGEDRYPLRQLQEIAEYVRGMFSAVATESLVRLLNTAGTAPLSITPVQASEFAGLLLIAARHRFMKPKLAGPTRLLADAAARAAAAGETWTWTPATA